MYRILMASSGYYYVQKQTRFGWSKTGGFFNTRSGARRFINDSRGAVRAARAYSSPYNVIEYV